MQLKPPSCFGCPFASRSKFYVPDEIVERAPVMIIGQNPGHEEEREGRPFIGKTGEMQEIDFFPIAGVERGVSVSIGNAIRCRLDDSNDLPELDKPELRQAIEHCTRAHLKVPSGTRLLVAQGKHALYALTGEGRGAEDTGEDEEKGNSARTITGWRGWVLPYNPVGDEPMPTEVWTPATYHLPVLAVNHLAALFRNPKMRLSMLRDWAKVPLILGGQWPERFPEIQNWPPPEMVRDTWAFDTEFVPETNHLIRYSAAQRTPLNRVTVYVVEGYQAIRVHSRSRIITHNADADLDHFESLTGLSWGQYDLDDTMHADAVLWGGQPHGLNYLGSLYARTNRWKHLVKTNPVQYSGGDALGTWDVWHALQPQLQRDPGSLRVYREQQLPLVHVIRRARAVGLKLNQDRVEKALDALEMKGRDAVVLAQAAAGFPLNLGSNPQVAQQLYVREGIKVQRRGRK